MIISTHIFMFPFRWDYKSEEIGLTKIEFENRVDIEKFKAKLSNKWEYKKFSINKDIEYNEYIYFYDYVREAIYNEKEFNENKTSYSFKYKHCNGGKYIIEIKNKSYTLDIYTLDIEDISLKLYDSGVGTLIFYLNNTKESQSSKDDILKINDFGRRIYPQFLAGENGKLTEAVKDKFLASKIKIELLNDTFEDTFCNFDTIEKVDSNPQKIADFILKLFGDNFKDNKEDLNKDKILINPIIDDRMFVVCWYGNNGISEQLKAPVSDLYNKEFVEYNYINSDFWYEYIFIDGGGKTCQSKIMSKELLKKHSYDRWIGYGTLYATTRYSLVAFSNDFKTLKKFHADYIPTHLKTMYTQMIALVLAQRASILRFSDEVTNISHLDEKSEDNLTTKVEKLHKEYIKFTNKIYFREVTAQEQGIELYDKMLEVMKIKENVKDLDNEISELYNYARLIEEGKTKKEVDKLTKLGSYFLPPTLVAGIFGMNVFGDSIANSGWVILSILFIVSSVIGFKNRSKIKDIIKCEFKGKK